MKKTLLSLFSALFLFASFSSAQTNSGWCATDIYLQNRIDANPGLAEEIHESMMQAASTQYMGPKALKTVPVVFHILHYNGEGNISDEQIQSVLDVLNEDFNRLNADTNQTRSTVNAPFKPNAGSMEIEFKLAKIDPNGNCTNGIIRKNVAYNITYDVDMSSEPHKFTANGGSSAWPRNNYFNIWIVNSIAGSGQGITLGYAQFPDNWGGSASTYGLTMRQDYSGTIGTAAGNDGRTITHEVGHCFGLFHIFQGGCHTSNCNSSGDYCCDTPPQSEANFSCSSTLNSCSQVPSNDSYGFDALDQIENYMSYNACQNMFSNDQINIMQNKISTLGHLTSLTSAANATATGINLPETLCKADFTSDRTTICVGDVVNFTDDSYNLVTGWNWSFPGGSPASSTDQNPSVTYSTPGYYEVTLSATDGSASDSEVKTAYIRVLPESATIPFLEGFEGYSSLSSQENWEVDNQNNNNTFVLESNFGHSGTKCVRLNNYGQPAFSIDELISSPVDLSSVTSSMTLSFRYAYRKRNTSDVEWLKVYITGDCGESWIQRKTLSGNSLSSLTSSTAWAPASASDWVTVHMTNVTSTYWVDNFRYKFRFESDGGNNFFLDDINIYPGAPSDNLVVGIAEEGEFADLALYPNPADAEVNIRFTVSNAQQMVITVKDITGKHVKDVLVNAAAGTNLVMMDTNELSSGSYFMTISNGEIAQTMKFVIQ